MPQPKNHPITRPKHQLSFAQIKLGICQDGRKLIDKGIALLELTDEDQMLTNVREKLNRLKN